MRILHCITSLDTGGAEKTLVRLVNNSSQNHLILTIKNAHKLREFLKNDVEIKSIFPISPISLINLFKSIKSFDPDLIQGWMYHGDLVASFLGVILSKPIFWNIRHGKMSLRYSSKKTLLIRYILSIFSYLIPKRIISCSYCGLQVHKEIGYCESKFYVIHNGINIDKNLSKNYENLQFQTPIKVASIGRNSPQKNRKYFLNILDSLSNYSSFEGVIVGRGIHNSPELIREKKYRNFPIVLNDSISNVEKIFKNIDVLLLTSVYGEGCPNIIIEAIKYGILVFSTDVGDAKYILNNERLIIPSTNHSEAARRIIKLLNSHDLKKVISDSKKRANLIFNENIMVKKYEDIWQTIL